MAKNRTATVEVTSPNANAAKAHAPPHHPGKPRYKRNAGPPKDPGPLATPVRHIQHYSVRRMPGVYLLRSNWDDVYVIVRAVRDKTDDNGKDETEEKAAAATTKAKTPTVLAWALKVTIPGDTPVVICRDNERRTGLRYRIRTSAAIVVSVEMERRPQFVLNLTPYQKCATPEGYSLDYRSDIKEIKAGQMMTLPLDTDEMNAHGSGIYIFPSKSEAEKALQFITI